MLTKFLLAGEITLVKEAIPWVRCASGNVLLLDIQWLLLELKPKEQVKCKKYTITHLQK